MAQLALGLHAAGFVWCVCVFVLSFLFFSLCAVAVHIKLAWSHFGKLNSFFCCSVSITLTCRHHSSLIQNICHSCELFFGSLLRLSVHVDPLERYKLFLVTSVSKFMRNINGTTSRTWIGVVRLLVRFRIKFCCRQRKSNCNARDSNENLSFVRQWLGDNKEKNNLAPVEVVLGKKIVQNIYNFRERAHRQRHLAEDDEIYDIKNSLHSAKV